MNLKERVEGCFLGLAVGDALGVPVEFNGRGELRSNPVRHMREFGTWGQPAGTWSDDSSLTFCLAESLSKKYDLADIGESFVKWMNEGYWGAHHEVFDIGGTTRVAISRISQGESPLKSGVSTVSSNGNGSLMRIVPASLYFIGQPSSVLWQRMQEISGITHGHFRSVFSCFVFSKIVEKVALSYTKVDAYNAAIVEVNQYLETQDLQKEEIFNFERVLNRSVSAATESSIKSSGYVIDTLEASIWCFLNTDSYSDAVLKAVNLGGDTDTTGCVTGAIAGLYYGVDSIPLDWQVSIARSGDIRELAERFQKVVRA
jgi:ADP-ribosyl-[dinitrogen reductase] hydrolase